jgi:hypothetical protein
MRLPLPLLVLLQVLLLLGLCQAVSTEGARQGVQT